MEKKSNDFNQQATPMTLQNASTQFNKSCKPLKKPKAKKVIGALKKKKKEQLSFGLQANLQEEEEDLALPSTQPEHNIETIQLGYQKTDQVGQAELFYKRAQQHNKELLEELGINKKHQWQSTYSQQNHWAQIPTTQLQNDTALLQLHQEPLVQEYDPCQQTQKTDMHIIANLGCQAPEEHIFQIQPVLSQQHISPQKQQTRAVIQPLQSEGSDLAINFVEEIKQQTLKNISQDQDKQKLQQKQLVSELTEEIIEQIAEVSLKNIQTQLLVQTEREQQLVKQMVQQIAQNIYKCIQDEVEEDYSLVQSGSSEKQLPAPQNLNENQTDQRQNEEKRQQGQGIQSLKQSSRGCEGSSQYNDLPSIKTSNPSNKQSGSNNISSEQKIIQKHQQQQLQQKIDKNINEDLKVQILDNESSGEKELQEHPTEQQTEEKIVQVSQETRIINALPKTKKGKGKKQKQNNLGLSLQVQEKEQEKSREIIPDQQLHQGSVQENNRIQEQQQPIEQSKDTPMEVITKQIKQYPQELIEQSYGEHPFLNHSQLQQNVGYTDQGQSSNTKQLQKEESEEGNNQLKFDQTINIKKQKGKKAKKHKKQHKVFNTNQGFQFNTFTTVDNLEVKDKNNSKTQNFQTQPMPVKNEGETNSQQEVRELDRDEYNSIQFEGHRSLAEHQIQNHTDTIGQDGEMQGQHQGEDENLEKVQKDQNSKFTPQREEDKRIEQSNSIQKNLKTQEQTGLLIRQHELPLFQVKLSEPQKAIKKKYPKSTKIRSKTQQLSNIGLETNLQELQEDPLQSQKSQTFNSETINQEKIMPPEVGQGTNPTKDQFFAQQELSKGQFQTICEPVWRPSVAQEQPNNGTLMIAAESLVQGHKDQDEEQIKQIQTVLQSELNHFCEFQISIQQNEAKSKSSKNKSKIAKKSTKSKLSTRKQKIQLPTFEIMEMEMEMEMQMEVRKEPIPIKEQIQPICLEEADTNQEKQNQHQAVVHQVHQKQEDSEKKQIQTSSELKAQGQQRSIQYLGQSKQGQQRVQQTRLLRENGEHEQDHCKAQIGVEGPDQITKITTIKKVTKKSKAKKPAQKIEESKKQQTFQGTLNFKTIQEKIEHTSVQRTQQDIFEGQNSQPYSNNYMAQTSQVNGNAKGASSLNYDFSESYNATIQGAQLNPLQAQEKQFFENSEIEQQPTDNVQHSQQSPSYDQLQQQDESSREVQHHFRHEQAQEQKEAQEQIVNESQETKYTELETKNIDSSRFQMIQLLDPTDSQCFKPDLAKSRIETMKKNNKKKGTKKETKREKITINFQLDTQFVESDKKIQQSDQVQYKDKISEFESAIVHMEKNCINRQQEIIQNDPSQQNADKNIAFSVPILDQYHFEDKKSQREQNEQRETEGKHIAIEIGMGNVQLNQTMKQEIQKVKEQVMIEEVQIDFDIKTLQNIGMQAGKQKPKKKSKKGTKKSVACKKQPISLNFQTSQSKGQNELVQDAIPQVVQQQFQKDLVKTEHNLQKKLIENANCLTTEIHPSYSSHLQGVVAEGSAYRDQQPIKPLGSTEHIYQSVSRQSSDVLYDKNHVQVKSSSFENVQDAHQILQKQEKNFEKKADILTAFNVKSSEKVEKPFSKDKTTYPKDSSSQHHRANQKLSSESSKIINQLVAKVCFKTDKHLNQAWERTQMLEEDARGRALRREQRQTIRSKVAMPCVDYQEIIEENIKLKNSLKQVQSQILD